MNKKVELIFDSNCPNVKDARGVLKEAFEHLGLQPSWQEWIQGASDSPSYVGDYGSPTILIDGKDVAGAQPGQSVDYCRIYNNEGTGRQRGVPPIEKVITALSSAFELATTGVPVGWSSAVRSTMPIERKGEISMKSGLHVAPADANHRFQFRSILAGIPGMGAALLPVGICPACWPAYAGILSSIGLGFLFNTKYLLPVTAVFLGLALFALGFRAGSRYGYGPLGLGMIAASMIMVFKFAFVSTLPVYIGIALLVGASFWNAWPRRKSSAQTCPACVAE